MTARDPGKFLQVLKKENVTILNQTPSAFYCLMDEELKFPSRGLKIRYIIFGGEALKTAKLKKWKDKYPEVKLINMYGITETTVHVTYKEISDTGIELDINNIGKPIPTLSTYVKDNNLKLLPIGVTGELCVGGEGVARGYLNRVELTGAKFVRNPGKPVEKLYRSGDLVRLLENGEMEYRGRIDQQVKIRGYRIEPGEIETQLLACAGLKEVVVIDRQLDKENAAPDEHNNNYLCAYFVSSGETALTASRLREHLAQKLPDYMIPSYFVQLEKIPLTANGKIDGKMLPGPQAASGENYWPPRNQVEEKLVGIWQKVLKVEIIGIKDSFFDMGGDSIKVIKLLSLINSALNTDLKIVDLYNHETIEKLSGIINRHKTTAENKELKKAMKELEELKNGILTENKLLWDIEDIEDIYPMSDIEKGMVYHSLKNPGKAVFHDQLVHQVKYKKFDPARFKKTLVLLVEKHPILRTSFNMNDFKEAVQIVHKKCPIDIRHNDISSMEKNRQKEYLMKFLEEDRRNPFDTKAVPLWRMRTFTLDQENVCIAWIFHHAILDGWSDASFKTELNNIYLTLKSNPGFVPGKLKGSYKEFVIEQIAEKKKTETIDYWRKELNDYKRLKLFTLEKKHNEPVANKAKFHNLGIPLRSRLTDAAAKHNTTLKNLCFGAYVYMLYMFSYENDMVVGLGTHNRPVCEDGEKILGCFLNTLPVRLKIPGNNRMAWSDYIGIIDKKMLELLKYERLSLFEIARVIGEDTADRNPIFDTFFGFLDFYVYDQVVREGRRERGKAGEDNLSVRGTTRTNTLLDFGITSMSDFFVLSFSYADSLLDDQEAEKLCLYFKNILNKFTDEPGSLANKNEIMTPGEKKRVLYDLNDTVSSSPGDKTIHDLFEKQQEKTPDHTAVTGKAHDRAGKQPREHIFLTYRELNKKSNQLAYLLKEKGLQPAAIVGIQMNRSLELVIGLLGILKAGSAYLPIDPAYPRNRINYMLADSSAGILLKGNSAGLNFNDQHEAAASMVLNFEHLNFEFAADQGFRTPHIKFFSPAYVIYTSGSTGRPKGVVVEHGNVVRLVKNSNYIDWEEGGSLAMTGSIAFDIATFEIWGPLLNSLCLYLTDENTVLDAEKLGGIITRNNISILHMTPLLFNQIAAQDIKIFANLKYFLVGGDLVRPRYINKLNNTYKNLKILHMYGPTENTVFSTFFSIDRAYETTIPIGVPVNNSTVYIVDKGNHLQPGGIAGELCTGGDGLARGYLNNPGLTMEKFIPNPFIKAEMIYKTGDLARWLPDGNLEFLGRTDEQVKIRGARIELREIEKQLLKHNQIEQTTVLAKEDKNGDKYLCAYFVRTEIDDKRALSLTEKQRDSQLKHYLSGTLPGYMIPSYFVQVENIPLTPNGKLDIKALPTPGTGVLKERISAENDIEEKLLELWSEVLEIEKQAIGVNSNFFKLGGHSLKAIKLVTKIRKELETKISVVKVFDIPTIRGLARYILGSKTGKYKPIKLAEKKEYYALSSAQNRLYFLQQIDSNSIGYNMPLVLSVAKETDKGKLEAIFRKMIARHESLRTSFIMVGERPVQKIYNEIDFALEFIDLETKPPGSSLSVEKSTRDFVRPFDLSKAPLLRVRLIKTGTVDAVLMIDIHHIITDGSAQLVLTKEFMKLNSGEELPPHRVQYKDYSEWQDRLLEKKDETLKKQEQYWLKRFEGQYPLLNLPCDYPGTSMVSFEGNSIGFTISPGLTTKIKGFSVETGTTLFMILLAVYNILLSKYTGQEDIVVGAPVTGRTHPDLQNLIGMTVNMLPIRNYPRHNQTFREFLAEVKENSLEAFNNQDYQFDILTAKLNVHHELGKHSLIDTVFVFQNIQKPAAQTPGDKKSKPGSTPYKIDYNISKFDLELSAEETQEEIFLNFDYRTQLFKKDTIELMSRHFLNIVDEVIMDPGIRISGIRMLDKKEQESLLEIIRDENPEEINQQSMIKINADFDF
jgi:amino acid adenylation domain-containing protein